MTRVMPLLIFAALAVSSAGIRVAPAALSEANADSSPSGLGADASDFCGLVGYTAITCSNVVGDFEGADFDKPVALDNGMIFTFREYNYSYSYRPDVVVFAQSVQVQGSPFVLYKLLIEDELYDVIRVR